MKSRRIKMLLTLLAAGLLLLLCVSVGSSNLPFSALPRVLGNRLFHLPLAGVGESEAVILWNLRFPRVLLAFLVGGALSVSGAAVQSVLQNPLASPFTLGVSSGASLGVGILMITGASFPFLGGFSQPICGLLCGVAAVAGAVLLASRFDQGLSSSTIVLTGMIFSLFINAVLMTLCALSRAQMQRITLWQMGSFSMRGWDSVALFLPFCLAGTAVLFRFHREFDLMTFGDEQAGVTGVKTKQVKWAALIASAVLTGSAVAFSGVIGFVDLASPHVVRRLFGPSHRVLIPFSFLIGGMFTVLADTVARTLVSPSELPVGVVCALVGGPFFAYLYFRKPWGGNHADRN